MDAESPALEDTKADSELSIADDTPPNEDRPPATKPTPFSGRFLDRSEAAAKCRHVYIKILIQRTFLIILAIFIIFPIFWGAVYRLPARSLEGCLVDFDGGLIGSVVVGELERLSGPLITWTVWESSRFSNGESDLINAVIDEQCWVAVSVNQGSSAKLEAALTGNTTASGSYNGSTAITAYGVEARNENAFRTLLRPTMETWLDQVTHDFAIGFVQELVSNSSIQLSKVPTEVLVRPAYYTLQNLRPFNVPVATADTYVGLIYLLILSFFVVNSGIMARTTSGLESYLSLGSLIIVRLISPISIYFIVSFFYTLVSAAFQVPFDLKFGHAGFVVFWMVAWFGMMAAGLALETMTTLMTVKYVPFFLILWIISNVSVCLWPIDALPKVYQYGHVAPFYQISRAVRTIVFRTRNQVGINFLILSVWIVISCFTLPMIQWYRRREEVREWAKQQKDAKD